MKLIQQAAGRLKFDFRHSFYTNTKAKHNQQMVGKCDDKNKANFLFI